MTPAVPLVQKANQALADETMSAQIVDMHSKNYSLIEMVETLHLDDDLTPELRQIIESIPPDVVEQIRKATLEMLAKGGHEMPIDCSVTAENPSPPLDITVQTINSEKRLVVTPKSA